MNNCLIGYTGFVGSNLMNQTEFKDTYNSKNIDMIKEKSYDVVVCAGAPAVKWKANQNPQQDYNNIQQLISNLRTVSTKYFILLSTVDVYQNPTLVDESTPINLEGTDPYGKHRYYLEEFVREEYGDYLIVRLPGLFGDGLKKNFIYDIIHNNCLHLTHFQSEFQFYNLNSLWKDIQIAQENNIKLINFCTEPVKPSEIAEYCMGSVFDNITEKAPVYYDMRSMYSSIYKKNSTYMKTKIEVLNEIKEFIIKEKAK